MKEALNVERRIPSKTLPAKFRSAEDRAMLINVYDEKRDIRHKSLRTLLGETRIK